MQIINRTTPQNNEEQRLSSEHVTTSKFNVENSPQKEVQQQEQDDENQEIQTEEFIKKDIIIDTPLSNVMFNNYSQDFNIEEIDLNSSSDKREDEEEYYHFNNFSIRNDVDDLIEKDNVDLRAEKILKDLVTTLSKEREDLILENLNLISKLNQIKLSINSSNNTGNTGNSNNVANFNSYYNTNNIISANTQNPFKLAINQQLDEKEQKQFNNSLKKYSIINTENRNSNPKDSKDLKISIEGKPSQNRLEELLVELNNLNDIFERSKNKFHSNNQTPVNAHSYTPPIQGSQKKK